MLHPSPGIRALHAILLVTLAVPPSAFADTTSAGSMATSTLQGMTGILGDVNGMFSAYGQSASQLQGLATQLAMAQQKAQNGMKPQSQFDQIQQKLSLAMAQANACVIQASTNNYDKYTAKRNAKEKDIAKNITPDGLTSVEPTCSTYGVILDAIELQKAKMADTNKKMACLTNLQAQVNQIAEAAKAPFQQLKDAADQVYETYSEVIDTHTQIANKLADQLDGPADKDGNRSGKGGYREELGKLKGMALELNNVINAKAGANSDGLKYGLVKQVKDLKQQRTSAANKWYFSLLQDVEYCYKNEPAPCFDNNVSLPAPQCVASVIQNGATGSGSTAGQRARANEDIQNGLPNIDIQNYVDATHVNLPANIDVAKPDEFLSFTQVRFRMTLRGVMGAYQSHHFASGVDSSKLAGFVQNAYQACYDKAVANFKSDIISKGGRYYQDLSAVQDAERETANDEKNWIDRVEGEMTNFRTMFQKVYSSDLAQFKTDCTASEDPYQGLDCLRVLDAQLQSGLRGTNVTTKLGNGTSYTSVAGETQIPVQTLTLDAQGKPTIGSSSVSCSGFDDCINYMDRAVEQHQSAAQQSTTDRKKFVNQHNQATKQAFQVVAGQFSNISQLLTSGVTGINQDLAKLGIKAQVKTKTTDPEQLQENEKTGLIDMPKSMKAALAGQNAYTELDDTQPVTDAYNQMLTDLNQTAVKAQKQKRLCQVSANDYKKVLGLMPNDCSNTKAVCSVNLAPQAETTFEAIFKKSVDKVDENGYSRSPNNSGYQSCVSNVKSLSNADLEDDQALNDYAIAHGMPEGIFKKNKNSDLDEADPQLRSKARGMMKAAKQASIQKSIQDQCANYIYNALSADADNSRGSLQQQNQDMIAALRSVASACSSADYDDKGVIQQNDDVTQKCEDFKKMVQAAKGATGEGETGTLGNTSNSSSDSPNPFTSGTAK